MMRRATSLFLLSLSKSKLKPSPQSLPKCLPKFAHKFTPSTLISLRHLQTLPNKPDNPLPFAPSPDEILESFAALERTLPPTDKSLGLAALKAGQHLDSLQDSDPEDVLQFATRALAILDVGSSDNSIAVAMALHLAGSATYNLKMFNDSLGFLNRANRILSKIESEGFEEFDFRPVCHAVQLLLANTKTALGRREEALVNLRNCLDIKVSILGPESRELGVGYRDLAEAYSAVLKFKEALPMCLKALEIHQGELGQNSVEVARDRRLLGIIYTGLEEHEKALEQNQLSQKVMKSWGMNSDLLRAEIDSANIQIELGKFDDAINTLKGVVQQTDKESEIRALVFISMAKAMCNQEKFSDAKRCLEISCAILEKKESEYPETVAEGFVEISTLYETMNDLETAICLLKKSLSMIEGFPQEHDEGNVSAKIGWLLLLTGKVSEAIPYLESAAERMKKSFGPKHFGVGYIYNNLGAAYMELDRPQSAAQMFALAKDIMDVSLGPHHADSIEACQSLANAYSAMGSYPLALDFQQQVVNAWENHGPSAKEQLKEAIRLHEQIKKKAFESLSKAISQEALPRNLEA